MVKPFAVLAIGLVAFAAPANAVYRGNPVGPPDQSEQIPNKTVKLDTDTPKGTPKAPPKAATPKQPVRNTARVQKPPRGQAEDQGLSPGAANAIGTAIGIGVGIGLGGMGRSDDDRGMRDR